MFKKSKQIIAALLSIAIFLSLAPITAFADTTQDGDNQQGIAGQDVSMDYNVNPNAFGCWRLYMARRDDGGIVGSVTDVGNVPRPAIQQEYNGTKLHAWGGALSGEGIDYKQSDKIPPLGSSMSALKAYWEADNYSSVKGAAAELGWGDEAVQKFIAGEYVIVMEPVAWFTFGGRLVSASATECANLNVSFSGLLKKYLGSFTHNEILGYAWLERQFWWGIPVGYPYSTDGMKYMLSDSQIQSTFGISIVYSIGGMCCPHSATDCACYSNATPPNLNPPEAPAKCKCFETHLKDPNNPIPCGPGVPNCDCYPPQCCEHPPSCPCQPGKHKDNDPTCECPDTHPGTPCGPDVPDCDCYPHGDDINTDLIIHEDEMTQALNAKMEAKGTKLQVRSVPAFQPASGGFKGSSCSCNGYTKKGKHKGDSGYHQYYNWVAPTVWEASSVTLNPNVSTNSARLEIRPIFPQPL